ncbi:methyltransferase domain-containing protein [Rickettsiales bacterium]|nr:methyltransferase domain-containing protein [Rickettsiales bacterium]
MSKTNKKNKAYGFLKARAKQIISATSFIASIVPSSKNVYKENKKEFKAWLAEARVKIKDPSGSNAELGDFFFKEAKFNDAVFRYKMSYAMNKNKDIFLKLGKSYLANDKKDKAKSHLQEYLELHPKSKEASYYLSIIDKEYKAINPSEEIIKESFEFFAEYFTDFYIEKTGYVGDTKITKEFKKEVKNKSKHLNILDLGCGSGIIGDSLKTIYPELSITGIDNCKSMITICKNLEFNYQEQEDKDDLEIIQNKEEKPKSGKTYDILVNQDFQKYIDLKSPKYQYILARGIINYYQTTNKFFESCEKALDKGGKLFFYSREKLDQEFEEDIKTNRFLPFYLKPIYHSKTAIENSLKKHNLTLVNSFTDDVEKNIKATYYEVTKK